MRSSLTANLCGGHPIEEIAVFGPQLDNDLAPADSRTTKQLIVGETGGSASTIIKTNERGAPSHPGVTFLGGAFAWTAILSFRSSLALLGGVRQDNMLSVNGLSVRNKSSCHVSAYVPL